MGMFECGNYPLFSAVNESRVPQRVTDPRIARRVIEGFERQLAAIIDRHAGQPSILRSGWTRCWNAHDVHHWIRTSPLEIRVWSDMNKRGPIERRSHEAMCRLACFGFEIKAAKVKKQPDEWPELDEEAKRDRPT